MIKATTFSKRWGGRTFRFRLRSFRISKSFYARRFSITEAATLLMLAYLTSKILGAVRQVLFNSLFGAGPAATAYYVAFSLPDTIFNLIAGGALVHALVPVFLSYEKDHKKIAVWRFVSLVFNVLLVTLVVLVLVAEIAAPQFVSNILAPGLTPNEKNLATTLMRIMLLQPLILGLGSIATAVLHSKRQFLPSAISIAIYDVGLIGGVLVARVVPHVGIYGPTVGLLVSAICQVAVLIPGLRNLGARYTFIWNLKHPGLRQLLRLLGPNVLTIGIISAGSIIITSFASYLPDKASIAALHNAALLFGLPLSLIGVTLASALLPQITAYATHGRYVRMNWTIWRFVGAAVLLSVPVAVLMYVLGKPVISILFQHGAFNAHASALTNTALLGYSIGLPGQVLGLLIVLGFYALKDALTPLILAVFELGTHIGLTVFLLGFLKGSNAVLALPLAASLSATAAASALCLILFLRLRAKVKMDRGMQRLLLARRQRLVREQQGVLRQPQSGSPIYRASDPGTLIALVRQHVAMMNNPATDPVAILEMLNHIRLQLRGDSQRHYEMVVQDYQQAAAIYANAVSIHFVLGQLHQQAGSYDKAIDEYMLSMQNGPFEVIARINAAQCLLLEGLPGVAMLQLQQAQQSMQSSSASSITPRIWAALPREEGELLQAPEAEISQLLARAYESKRRQEQMHTFLRQVKQTPSSYHEVPLTPKQMTMHHYNVRTPLQEIMQQEAYNPQTYKELADIYKIRGVLHETVAKLCEQSVNCLRNNELDQAATAIQCIGAMYAELGNVEEALTHMRRAAELTPDNLDLLQEIASLCLQMGRPADAERYQATIDRFSSEITREVTRPTPVPGYPQR